MVETTSRLNVFTRGRQDLNRHNSELESVEVAFRKSLAVSLVGRCWLHARGGVHRWPLINLLWQRLLICSCGSCPGRAKCERRSGEEESEVTHCEEVMVSVWISTGIRRMC